MGSYCSPIVMQTVTRLCFDHSIWRERGSATKSEVRGHSKTKQVKGRLKSWNETLRLDTWSIFFKTISCKRNRGAKCRMGIECLSNWILPVGLRWSGQVDLPARTINGWNLHGQIWPALHPRSQSQPPIARTGQIPGVRAGPGLNWGSLRLSEQSQSAQHHDQQLRQILIKHKHRPKTSLHSKIVHWYITVIRRKFFSGVLENSVRKWRLFLEFCRTIPLWQKPHWSGNKPWCTSQQASQWLIRPILQLLFTWK